MCVDGMCQDNAKGGKGALQTNGDNPYRYFRTEVNQRLLVRREKLRY